ncbi:hypothetical protein GW756_01575 [bacterium]|nr:hypothetical protein [bacterium]NCQ55044.1 hypothetical protein [Candidatus Parcubacteria bacterium]NCS67088.1 hypothetical protein [Candidatus Peregrinibacteria bacterium]NCS96034.1 hypothetical protein [bacterium]
MEKIQRKANRWAQIIGHLPGVAAVFLSGSMVQGISKPTSDIDFFIIAIPGRIWTARFFTNLLLKLTSNLAKPAYHRARICPNHFISAQNLEIVEQDAYSAHLFTHNLPLYDPYDLWPKFIESNSWVNAFGEAFPIVVTLNENQSKNTVPSKKINFIETTLRFLQIFKIRRNPDFKKPGAKIILKADELRFHPDPKNQYWEAKQKNVDLGKLNRQADVEITL